MFAFQRRRMGLPKRDYMANMPGQTLLVWTAMLLEDEA